MTSFSSSSTAHPTGRLLCSACRLGIMGSHPLASVTRRVLVPPPLQRTSTHSCPPAPNPRILSFTVLESTLPPRALVLPRSSAVDRRMGEGPDTHFSSCWRQGGSGLHSTTLEPRGSVVPAGGARRTPQGWQTLSPEVCPDSASSQSRGVCHPLPTSCPSAACPLTTPA